MLTRHTSRALLVGAVGTLALVGLTGCPADGPIPDYQMPNNMDNNEDPDMGGDNSSTADMGGDNSTSNNTTENNSTENNSTENNSTENNATTLTASCRLQAQSPVTAIAGSPTATLNVLVYAEGVTEGQGAGMGVVAELGWGAGGDAEAFTYAPMEYGADRDDGGLDSDEYGAALTIEEAGTYRYAARVKFSSAPDTWLYCDLDGSDNGVSEDQLGVLEVGEEQQSVIGACQLQAQSPVMATTGEETETLLALVYAEGLTEGQGQGSLIEGQIGWGKMASSYEAFTYVPMFYSDDRDGMEAGDLARDEYGARISVSNAGTYKYAARFRITEPESPWFYCDLDGHSGEDDFELSELGTIEVTDPVKPSVGFCRTETQSVTAKPGEATMAIRGVVYSAGSTNMLGEGGGVTGQLVWGEEGTDPMSWTDVVTATYLEDADGLMPGDLANDRYEATLTISTEGEYEYAYRFSVDGGQSWAWCDLDGSTPAAMGFEPSKVGSLVISSAPTERITYCDTETLSAQALVGQASGPITGTVYSMGVTDMNGQGPLITGELIWGPAGTAPSTWTDSVAATYLEDTDGLVPGDNAKDRWEATITPPMAGDYEYAYRFSLDGGQTWSLCDTDGSDGTAMGFEPARVGALEAQVTNTADDCKVQFPVFAGSVVENGTLTVYGRVKEIGMTDVGDGDPAISAELWVGPLDADPDTEPMRFDKLPATLSTMPTNLPADEDEFLVDWSPTAAGSYKFLYRFSVDSGVTWRSCDWDGGVFEGDRVGAAVVHAAAPDTIDYCHVFQSSGAKSLASMTDPVFTAEVYEDGVTASGGVGNGGANAAQIEAQLGYGDPLANPALPMTYTWRDAPFSKVNPSNPSNYEYQAEPYDPMTPPAQGTYGVVFRVREAGQSDAEWVYCDNLNTTMDLLLDHVSTLDVAP